MTTQEMREKFEADLDKNYGDGIGHFTNGAKTRHVADMFERFHTSVLEEILKKVRDYYRILCEGDYDEGYNQAVDDISALIQSKMK